MATTDQLLTSNNTTTEATSNVEANVDSVSTSAQQASSLSTATSSQDTNYTVPTAVEYTQPTTTSYSDVAQTALSNYQSSSSSTQYIYPSVTIPTTNTNTIEGQYESAYSSAINQIANNLLSMYFSYNPSEDDLLQQATQYATQSTLESMNSKGILNSSMTAERVASVVGKLIPTYEAMAREEFDAAFSQMLNIANLLMTMDDRAFEQWQDARDQQWKEQEFAYQQQQDAIQNAWQRVDELGYVDNEAALVLGVAVGTLSKDAREALEAYEREIEEWNRQHEIEKQTEIELLQLKQDLEKEMYDYQSSVDLSAYESQLQLASNYSTGTSTGSSKSTVSLSTYEGVIQNRWATQNYVTGQYTVSDNDAVYDYLYTEYAAGRLSASDAATLIAKYNIQTPGTTTTSTTSTTSTSVTLGLTSSNINTWIKAVDGNNSALSTLGVTINGGKKGKYNNTDVRNAVKEALSQIEAGTYIFTTNQQLMNDITSGKFGNLGWGL